MNAGWAARSIATLSLATLAAAAPPQVMRTAPQPAIVNPNIPRPPPQNPKPLPGGTPHHEQYTALEFTFWTGDDDLRGDSDAWVDLNFTDGTSQRCELHAEFDNGWDNNTMNKGRQCILSKPRRWNELRSATMVLNLHSMNDPISYGQTSDNWNVNQVMVTAIDPIDKHYPCLLDVRGSPLLIRLTDNYRNYTLTATENRC